MTEKPALDPASVASKEPGPITGRRKQQKCRYFFGRGCRAGEGCSFSHDAAIPKGSKEKALTSSHAEKIPASQEAESSRKAAQSDKDTIQDVNRSAVPGRTSMGSPATSKVFRPRSEAEKVNPREFQLNQLRRRFSPTEKEDGASTSLTINMVPTDPDFPFEMRALNCHLTVPSAYPKEGRPLLRVSNPEMDRGYQINVERGFDSLVTSLPGRTLLALMNELDKRLESFLTAEKAPTITLVANRAKASLKSDIKSSAPENVLGPAHYTQDQLFNAKAHRESDIQQLQAHFEEEPLFSASNLNLSFMIPVKTTSTFPASLQSIAYFDLHVPTFYNLEPCFISFGDIKSAEATTVVTTFLKHARSRPSMTLIEHIDYLTKNMRLLAAGVYDASGKSTTLPHSTPRNEATDLKEGVADRPHLHFIPKPPEWDRLRGANPESDSEESSSSEDDGEDDEDEEEGEDTPKAETSDVGPDLGIRLSFPSLELYGIELLQLKSVSVIVKCDRCKEGNDVKNVQARSANDQSRVKHESCQKCTSMLSVGYRSEPMHANSVRAGYLDLEGCTVLDLLPSSFFPTCSSCSTTLPAPGITSVRGETSTVNCHECHTKLTFKIPDIKFLRVTPQTSHPLRPLPPRRKPKENLGLTSGTELPRRGRCTHYSKSYRWFRFSCCGRVYPCDRCHEDNEVHVLEHANRMICGFCSREQPYRPEDCLHCRAGLVGKSSGGFWEGGKGTRDKTKMSRKDPRKFKRRGGTAVGSAKGKK